MMKRYILITLLIFNSVILSFGQPKTHQKIVCSKKVENLNPNAFQKDIIVPEHGMADPHAWVENDTLWIICGHDKSWEPSGSFPMDRWEIWSSADLENYTYHTNILPKDTYIGNHPNCWAGDITKRNGKYYWYFSNRNINTGVVVSDKINGSYKDVLGKPLLPKNIVDEHPYDPEIYEENGIYTICFGSGRYYMATLNEDMISLATDPKHIWVYDKEGKEFITEDKPTIFKRKDKYYLVFGSRYAMADQLYGPYTFEGAFLSGGHTSFFDWKGQKYVLQENHDISAFYRGASLKPVFFHTDGTIHVPKSDRWYPGPGRSFLFQNSTMGWKALNGTDLQAKKGTLSGNFHDKNAIIQSASWLYTNTDTCTQIKIKIRNNSKANVLKIALYTRDFSANFWSEFTKPVDWKTQEWVSIKISQKDKSYQTYIIKLSEFSKINEKLMQLAIQPGSDTDKGKWEIDEIIFE